MPYRITWGFRTSQFVIYALNALKYISSGRGFEVILVSQSEIKAENMCMMIDVNYVKSDELVSVPAMIGTVVVFLVFFSF